MLCVSNLEEAPASGRRMGTTRFGSRMDGFDFVRYCAPSLDAAFSNDLIFNKSRESSYLRFAMTIQTGDFLLNIFQNSSPHF